MMKILTRIKTNRLLALALIAVLLLGIAEQGSAQDIRSRLSANYTQKADNSKILSAKLLLRQGRRYTPAEGLTVKFTLTDGENEKLLGTALTDNAGEAMMILAADYQLPVNEELFTVFSASFEGNDSCRASSTDMEIKALDVQIALGDSESKTITVTLQEQNEEGETVPVVDEAVTLSINRLFSKLPIAVGSTDENGVFEFTYEDDIPGDAEGNITIVAQMIESSFYGTVEAEKQALWGEPVDHTVDVSARALWTNQAPLWMLVATFIVLAGVWFNFGLAIYNLLKVKRQK